MDPEPLTKIDWTHLGTALHFVWLFVISVVGFASMMLLAHAVIPSLLNSGHIPEGLRNRVRKQRFPIYGTAIIILGVIAFWLSGATDAAHEIRNFWPRNWI